MTEAVRALKPAKLSLASIPVEEGPAHDMTHLVGDLRDPVIIDNVLHLVQLDDAWIGFAVDARGVTLGRLGPLEPPTVASAARWAVSPPFQLPN